MTSQLHEIPGAIITNRIPSLSVGDSSSHTDLSSSGMTMTGDARRWRDHVGDAVSLQRQGPGVSRNVTESTVDFADSANLSDYMFVNVQLNHDKDVTTAIFPHLHWFQAQAVLPNFLIKYRWHINGGTKTTAWSNYVLNNGAHSYVTGTLHQISRNAAGTGISPPAGSDLSDIVQFQIFRDTGNASSAFSGADPYTGTVGVLSFDVHMQFDALGSATQYAK